MGLDCLICRRTRHPKTNRAALIERLAPEDERVILHDPRFSFFERIDARFYRKSEILDLRTIQGRSDTHDQAERIPTPLLRIAKCDMILAHRVV